MIGRTAEVLLIAERTFENGGQDLGKVLQPFVADVLEPGSRLGNRYQAVCVNQPIKKDSMLNAINPTSLLLKAMPEQSRPVVHGPS